MILRIQNYQFIANKRNFNSFAFAPTVSTT